MTALRKIIRHYPLIWITALIGAVFFTLRIYLGIDLFAELLESLSGSRYLEADEFFILAVLGAMAWAVDQTRNVRRQRSKSALRAGRIQAMHSTMATVHDIVNNALNNLLLIQLEAERGEPLKPETLALFEKLISDTAERLREIDALESLAERSLGNRLVSLNMEADGTSDAA